MPYLPSGPVLSTSPRPSHSHLTSIYTLQIIMSASNHDIGVRSTGAIDYISRASYALWEGGWEGISNLTINDRGRMHLGDLFHSPQTTCTNGFLSVLVWASG